MDAATFAGELSRPSKSRFWQQADRSEIVSWVFDETPARAPLAELPGAVDVRAEMADLHDRDPASWLACAVAGEIVRLTVPLAARTAGQFWFLNSVDAGVSTNVLRVTVGKAETAAVVWSADLEEFRVMLRPAASPIESAIDKGSLDEQEMAKLQISESRDGLVTLAEDAVRYRCPTGEAALWMLRQRDVVRAARLMNARLCTTGFAFERLQDPRLLAMAWAAAEDIDTGAGRPRAGFHRPYSGRRAEGKYPEHQGIDPALHEAAIDEHDALCRLLVERLGMLGLPSGELEYPAVDLAWLDSQGGQCIAEIKSCLANNDRVQFRLGLGQVLEYRYRTAHELGRDVDAYLLLSRVEDPGWFEVGRSVGVHLLDGRHPHEWRIDGPDLAAQPTIHLLGRSGAGGGAVQEAVHAGADQGCGADQQAGDQAGDDVAQV